MALRHWHSPTIVSRVFIGFRCIFVQRCALDRALSGHCHLCSLSRVRHAIPDISNPTFEQFFFTFPWLEREQVSREECRARGIIRCDLIGLVWHRKSCLLSVRISGQSSISPSFNSVIFLLLHSTRFAATMALRSILAALLANHHSLRQIL